MKIAVTGHRPDKLGGYDAKENFTLLRNQMVGVMLRYPLNELTVISGGALGIDQLWMEAALSLKLPVIAALPFEGYDGKWPEFSKKEYKKLLDKCQLVKYICEPGYQARKLQIRNEWMVDECDRLYAYWNRSGGGTANCVRYAEVVMKPTTIFNTNELLCLGK